MGPSFAVRWWRGSRWCFIVVSEKKQEESSPQWDGRIIVIKYGKHHVPNQSLLHGNKESTQKASFLIGKIRLCNKNCIRWRDRPAVIGAGMRAVMKNLQLIMMALHSLLLWLWSWNYFQHPFPSQVVHSRSAVRDAVVRKLTVPPLPTHRLTIKQFP